jgi:hypothetical protein
MSDMPNVHRNPAITPRPPAELRERAKAAVQEVGSDLNAHIIGFLRWLVHDTDEMPKRPASPVPKLPE